MFTYENGLMVSFLLYCYYVCNLIITINSTAERNLNLVGERFSWLSLRPKEMAKSDFDRPMFRSIGKFVFVISFSGLFVLLSWINVTFYAVGILYFYFKDKDAPTVVKEFRWKLRNVKMTFDEMVVEIIKINGSDMSDFDNIRNDLLQVVASRKVA